MARALTASPLLHVAVVEYDSDESPRVHIALSESTALRTAIADVRASGYDMSDDPDFVANHPIDPETAPLRELRAWVHALHEAVTVPWITLTMQYPVGRSPREVWGQPYGSGPAYAKTLYGRGGFFSRRLLLEMRRKGQKVRFFDLATDEQVGPEQPNVAPAVAWAHANGFTSV